MRGEAQARRYAHPFPPSRAGGAQRRKRVRGPHTLSPAPLPGGEGLQRLSSAPIGNPIVIRLTFTITSVICADDYIRKFKCHPDSPPSLRSGVKSMKTRSTLWLFAVTAIFASHTNTARAETFTRIEFMWEAPERGSGAWSQALGLTLHPEQPHRICMRAYEPAWLEANVRLEAIDAAGTRAVIDEYQQTRIGPDGKPIGPLFTACRDLKLPAAMSHPGLWQFELFIDDKPAASTKIKVVDSVSDDGFVTDPLTPYVRGRINPSREALTAPEFKGHLKWRMTVDATGKVIHAEILEEQGVGTLLKAQGLRAAYLTRYAPDAMSTATPRTIDQVYNFSP